MAEGQKTKSPSPGSGNGSGLDSQINQSESAKSSMTPDFLKSSETNPNKPSNNAMGALGKEGDAARAGEDEVASDKPGQKQAEYENKVKGKKEAAKAMAGGAAGVTKFVAKNGLKGAMKKAGPIGGIIIAITMFMFMAFGSQGNMLFGLVSRIGVFDPVDLANSVRSRVLMKSIMRGNNTEGGVWHRLSDKIKKKLGVAGVEVEEDADGTKLKTETETGETKITTADTLDNDIATDNRFLTQYSDGTSSVGNSVHSNYGEEAEVLYDGVRVNRGDLNDIKANDDYDTAKAAFDEKIKDDFESGPKMSGDVDDDRVKQETDTDDEGNPVIRDVDTETETGRVNVDSEADADAKIRGTLETDFNGDTKANIDMDAIGLGGKVANGICQVYNTLTSIGRMVKAYELAQVIVVAFKIFQAIQRMQAGDGGADVLVDVVGTYLVTEKVKNYSFNSGAETFTVVGSAMSSTPIASLFGGAPLTQGDPIVRGFLTTDSEISNFLRGINNGSSGGYRTCIGTQLTAAVIDFFGDIASLFTAGILSIIKSFAISAVFSGIVALGVAFLVPKAVAALTRNFTDLLMGPEASGGMIWGGSYVQERLGQMFGFRPANDKSWATYAVERTKLLAERARYDRATKSPFDTSSEYTFMGTIMSNLNTMSLKTTTIFGKAGNILSVVGKSFLNLTPASYADDADRVSEGACAANEINGTSEADIVHCNAFEVPWNVPDFDTMGMNPEEVMWYWQNHVNQRPGPMKGKVGSFESDYDPVTNPNPPIKADTDLALHIEEYNNRGSELNVPDSEIENKYSPASTGSGLLDAIIGAIPVGGSIIDIINNTDKAEHIDQILGSQYTGETLENDMAERYSQDQDMGVAFGAYDESQTAVYIKKYYEKHPLDNSMEGIIARLSGLSKEEVIADLEFVNTYTFIAQYEPAGLGPVVIEEKDSSQIYIENEDNYLSPIAILIKNDGYYFRKDQYVTA